MNPPIITMTDYEPYEFERKPQIGDRVRYCGSLENTTQHVDETSAAAREGIIAGNEAYMNAFGKYGTVHSMSRRIPGQYEVVIDGGYTFNNQNFNVVTAWPSELSPKVTK